MADSVFTKLLRPIADATGWRAKLGLAIGTDVQAYDADLAAIAALTTTSYGRAFLQLANQAALMALLSAASDSAAGIVELATDAEAIAATDATRALTPDNLEAVLFGDAATYTIATGSITITKYGIVQVDTEGGGATDTLNTINGGRTGAIIELRSANSSRDTTVADGTGNIFMAGNFTLTNTQDTLLLGGVGSNWLELSRSDNA